MPCNADYMQSNDRERKLSQVACLLDELEGKTKIDRSHWVGYHPRVYGKLATLDGDALVAQLCDRLQGTPRCVDEYSLEMQIWWRDHKEADRIRLQTKRDKAQDTQDREVALRKLSNHERKLLGL